MQKNGPNRKLLRSIVSFNPAPLAQSKMDQYRANARKAPTKSSRHINTRFHALHSKADFEADFLNKPLPTPLYEQLRRDMDANENYSNKSLREIETITRLIRIEIKYLWTKQPNILQVKSHKY